MFSIRFLSPGLPPLTVVRVEGREAMNELFHLDAVVYGIEVDEAALEPQLLGAKAVIAIQVPGSAEPRTVAGIVIDVAILGRTEGGRRSFRLRVAPRAWLLTKRVGTRIFQERTAADIAGRVLAEHRVPHRFLLTGKYPVREYCVQYQESDWDFVTRLFAEEAFFFWFEQPEGDAAEETLVVADSPRAYGAIPSGPRLRYRADQGGSLTLEEDMVTDFRARSGLETAVLTLRDYDFERPALDLTTGRVALEAPLPPLGGASLEHYEHHGEYEETDVDVDNARAGLDQLRARVRTAQGKSVCRRLAPGLVFELADHDVPVLDRPYVVTSVTHEGVAPKVAAGAEPYRNHFEVVPAEVPCCLPKPPRRLRQTLESAVVVGPEGQEIYTDRYGRVKVQFHWDREGRRNENSSCFLRVAQAWSGPDFGHQFVPRIGMEVLVSFLGGDPDRPIVIGCVPNAFNPPQYALPGAATRSGIRTRTSPGGGGSNELTFEDRAGAELLYLHAQRNLEEEVGLDRAQKVGRHATETIGADQHTKVGGHRTDETAGDHRTSVSGDRAETVGGNATSRIAASRSVEVGASDSLNVAAHRTLTVGGHRKEQVRGADDLLVEGDRSTVIRGEETRVVWSHARTILSGGASVNVGGGLALSIGSKAEPASAEGTISGDLSLRGDGAIDLVAQKSVRLRVGKTIVTIGPDEVSIEAETIKLAAKSIRGASDKATLAMGEAVELSGKTVKLFSADKAILELSEEAKLDGQSVKLKPGLAAEMAKRDEREEQAKNLEKVKVHLFDRKGRPLQNAPYEVSFFGYFDEGTSADGTVEIPSFPDVEKAHVRWGRPMDQREKPNPDEPYEFEMDVYLVVDAPDEDEALRRKLHNLGHQGGELSEAIHKYQAAAGNGRTGRADDVRADVDSRHTAVQPHQKT
jgi:type VI secretion system secreted protein VgrG